MRFVLALIAFLIGGLLVAVGVAEQTVLKPADHITVSSATPNVHYLLVPAAALRTHEGHQLLQARASGDVWMGSGTTEDVAGWLAGSSYATAVVNGSGKLAFKLIKASSAAQGVADPAGSDMWLQEVSGGPNFSSRINAADGQSLLLAAGGGTGTFKQLSVRWPVLASTPYASTFITFGIVLALLGGALVMWAILHTRQFSARPRSFSFGFASRARKLTATMIALIVALAATVVGSSSADAAQPEQLASMTEAQAQRVVQRITEVVAQADDKLDAKLLAERMAGPVLQQRSSNYKILTKDDTATTLQSIPQAASVQLILPQATATWPRTFFAVLSPEDSQQLPVALLMKQTSARENYKLWYATTLQAGAKLPSLPSAVAGGSLLANTTDSLAQAPLTVAKDYGLLLRDSQAAVAGDFATDEDYLLASVGEGAKKAAAKAVGSTAKITFSDLPVESNDLIVLKAADGSALVATQLDERWVVKPRKKGVTVKPSGSTKILSKTSATKKGIEATYGYQLLFSVPAKGSDAKVQLIGYSQGLLRASEVK